MIGERAMALEQVFLRLASSHSRIENLLLTHGLGDIETAWVMYAYVNGEDDESSFKRVFGAMYEHILLECGAELHFAEGITRLVIYESFDRGPFTVRRRAAIVGVSKSTFDRKKTTLDFLIDAGKGLIAQWEDAALNTAISSGFQKAV